MFSNLTAQEELRLTGTLALPRIEELLELDDKLKGLSRIGAHIDEAMAQYPAEDFLTPIMDRLHQFSKRLRGDNRSDLLAIIETIDDFAQCTFNAADYGRNELRKATRAIEAAKV